MGRLALIDVAAGDLQRTHGSALSHKMQCSELGKIAWLILPLLLRARIFRDTSRNTLPSCGAAAQGACSLAIAKFAAEDDEAKKSISLVFWAPSGRFFV